MSDKTTVLNDLKNALGGSNAASLPGDLHGFIGTLGAGAARIAFENLAHDEIKRVLPRRLKWAAPIIVALAGASGVYGMDINQIGNFFSRGGNMANQNQQNATTTPATPPTPPTPAGIDTTKLSSGQLYTLKLMLLAFNADHLWDTTDSPFEVITRAHNEHGDTTAAEQLLPTPRSEFLAIRGHLNFLRDVRARMMAADTANEAERIYSANKAQVVHSGNIVELFVEGKCIHYWDTVSMRASRAGGGLATDLVNQVREATTRLFGAVDDASSVYQRIILYKRGAEGVKTTLSAMEAVVILIPLLLLSAIIISGLLSAFVGDNRRLWWFLVLGLVGLNGGVFTAVFAKTESSASAILLAPLGLCAVATVVALVGGFETFGLIVTMVLTGLTMTGAAWALIQVLPHAAKELVELLLLAFKAFIPGHQADIKAWRDRIDGWDMTAVRQAANYAAIGVGIFTLIVMVLPLWQIVT